METRLVFKTLENRLVCSNWSILEERIHMSMQNRVLKPGGLLIEYKQEYVSGQTRLVDG